MPLIQLVLFDLGGPIVCNGPESGYDFVPLPVARALGLDVSQQELDRLTRQTVDQRAARPAYAMLWQLCRPDRDRFEAGIEQLWAFWAAKGIPPARPAISAALETLSARYKLGLLTNYPGEWQERYLAAHGLEHFFPDRLEPRHRKPDLRAFEAALAHFGCPPDRAVMVGDRLDNDIGPAKRLGLHTLWMAVGVYRRQAPRTPYEEPDETVTSAGELAPALERLETRLAAHAPATAPDEVASQPPAATPAEPVGDEGPAAS